MTEIIDGPIASVDRVYAFERIRAICREAPRVVQRARARLTAEPHPTGDSPATAECWLLLDGGLIVCAGVAASSVRDAVDGLMARLRRRLRIVDAERRSQRIESFPANATSLASLTTARTVSAQSPGIGRLTPGAM
jgi:hypothetical protein